MEPADAAPNAGTASPERSPAAAEQTPQSVSTEILRSALQEALQGKDLSLISLGEIRRQVACNLGFHPDLLDFRKKEIKKIARDVVQELQRQQAPAVVVKTFLEQLLEEEEKMDALQYVYLITVARVLDATLPDGRAYADLKTTNRKTIAEAVLNAFDDPLAMGSGTAGGRPRQKEENESMVALLVVYREAHADGSVHFHVVVKLLRPFRFKNVKRTLRERHLLPSHFSCSHTLLWSAVRYGYIETPAKPDVDETPWIWTPSWSGFAQDQTAVDLFALSQEPYRADSWRKRREAEEKEASKKKAKTTFTKLDLTSIIISKHLYSKDGLMAYAQEHGTHVMKMFVHSHQRRLALDIEDAKEWAAAPENANFEAVDDWTLMCRCAEKVCPHGEDKCTYKAAAQQIFARNAATLSERQLARGVRDILVHGPKKTTRVPFLVGPSNSGKSTLLYPFDDLFSPRRVLHKPALGSSFGLRNLVGGTKRLIFWDDFRPVEFAQEKTVPVSLFLSLFVGQYSEIQVSQSFNDGNKDVQWTHGALFTGKEEGLWEPTTRISPEDIHHMRNRVREFKFSAVMAEGSLQDVVSCAPCMARWVVNGANACDAAPALQPALPTPTASHIPAHVDAVRVMAISGLKELVAAVQLPGPVCEAILEDLEELGAAGVSELTAADWASLNAWSLLRPLQKRRLLQHSGAK
jgi:hypothetical protein